MSFPISSASSTKQTCPSPEDGSTKRKKARFDKNPKREIQAAPECSSYAQSSALASSHLPAGFSFASHAAPFQFAQPPAALALQQSAFPFAQSLAQSLPSPQKAAAAASEPDSYVNPFDTDEEELCAIFKLPFTPKEQRAKTCQEAPPTRLARKTITALQPQACAAAKPLSHLQEASSHKPTESSDQQGYDPFLSTAGFAPQVSSYTSYFDGIEGFAPLYSRWDYQKNTAIGLTPAQTLQNSHPIAFWRCVNNVHTLWMSAAEVLSAQECPMCLGSSY